jgi:NTP pyrophosphatase (non-canonical NTP hydrolase)
MASIPNEVPNAVANTVANTVATKQSYETKKQLLEEIKLLSKEECEEVFRIIKRNHVEYTENSNGVFFDLTQCSNEVCLDLEKLLELSKTQRKNEEQRSQALETLRQESTK